MVTFLPLPVKTAVLRGNFASMNYRHAFHAGNFADVLKHIVLCRVLEYMKRKDKAFRVFDIHAGIGLYDLESDEASRTGEWKDGIEKLVTAELPAEVGELLAGYLEVVASFNDQQPHSIAHYPGSPCITRKLMRKQDRLSLYELHSEDVQTLKTHFTDDYQTRVYHLDGWLAVGSHLPPKERRGLVLIDPPFEQVNEFETIINNLAKAHKKWSGGTYIIWYPVKNTQSVSKFVSLLKAAALGEVLRVEQTVAPVKADQGLSSSGLVIINPPYVLVDELKIIMPFLDQVLGRGTPGTHLLEWV